uniref:Uncharacterized protein n=1 Tax=Picea glauca TaxID=3330 RepID=A0A117NIX1_PICGL|nr:hypothetical protein ABT39_MTgene401 [Picea glauca]QHR92188.1 hypothetical protein Q903MT_gene6225 [Picea sitchensis]
MKYHSLVLVQGQQLVQLLALLLRVLQVVQQVQGKLQSLHLLLALSVFVPDASSATVVGSTAVAVAGYVWV